MIWFILCILAILGAIGFYWRAVKQRKWQTDTGVLATVITLIVGPFTGVPLSIWANEMTTGMFPEYSKGVRMGYITKVSKKGILWKTWEADLQMGSGEQAAVQSTYSFSIKDDELAKEAEKNIGKHVLVEYEEWFIMPYSIGESGYEAKKIVLVDPKASKEVTPEKK